MPNTKGSTRKTTAQLMLSGAMDKDPKRYANRRNPIKPQKPLGNPPNFFSKEQKAIWKEVVANTADDVLFSSDRFLLEMVVELIDKQRKGTIRAMERSTLLAALQRMGMTPLDRDRIQAPSDPDKTKASWSELLLPPPVIDVVITPDDVHAKSEGIHITGSLRSDTSVPTNNQGVPENCE